MAISTDQVKTVKFWLPGRVVPKARPRFHGGKISLTRNYRGWKNKSNRARSSASFKRMVLKNYFQQKASVEMQFIGSHRGDLDNERWGSLGYFL